MVPEEVKKWVGVFERITSTTAIILLVLYFVWQNTGDRNNAIYAAKASAEESVVVGREIKVLMEGHTKLASEDSALMRMVMIQICENTSRNIDQFKRCANYR